MNFVSPSGHSHNVHNSDDAESHPGHSVLKKHGWQYRGTGEGFAGNLEHHFTHPSAPKEHIVLQKAKHANGEVEHVWRQYGSKGGYKEGRNAEGLHHASVKEGKEDMRKLTEQENGALAVTTAIESLLKQKTKEAIEETRKQVAAETFGMSFQNEDFQKVQEDAEIDAAYNDKVQLAEWPKADKTPDVPLATELKNRALYNHHQYHAGNHDAHHGGWAMHDLHTWAKNYAKKKDKGVYDREKAVKGLTHAIKNSEPSYFGKAHHEKSGQTISGVTRHHAAQLLLPHVEELMKQHQKKTVKESETEVNEAALEYKYSVTLAGYRPLKFRTEKAAHDRAKALADKHKTRTTVHQHGDVINTPSGKQQTKKLLGTYGPPMKESEVNETTTVSKKEDPYDLAGTLGLPTKKSVKIMGHTVKPGTKKHSILFQQKKHADDLQRNEDIDAYGEIAPYDTHKAMQQRKNREAVKIMGHTVKPGTKKHSILLQQKKHADDLQKNEEEVVEAREPQKNTGVHERLRRHGFEYKGTKNGFRHYEHPKTGDEVKHKFPTLNGNHSFTHTGPNGKVVTKSANTGDTEIQNHLDKHFPVPSRSSAWKVDKSVNEEMLNEVLIPGERLTPEQHKHVLSAFVHRHTGEHTPDWVRHSDDHHTPTHKTDKDWVHDHAFHFNKKTGKLSGKHKYAEPHYKADNVREAEKEHHAVSKPAAKSAMPPEEVKVAKKRAWQNDERMPWPKDYFMHKGQSPIHSFAEHIRQEGK